MFDHKVTIFRRFEMYLNKKIIKPIRSFIEDHQDLVLWIIFFILLGFVQD